MPISYFLRLKVYRQQRILTAAPQLLKSSCSFLVIAFGDKIKKDADTVVGFLPRRREAGTNYTEEL